VQVMYHFIHQFESVETDLRRLSGIFYCDQRDTDSDEVRPGRHKHAVTDRTAHA
jgi:hypothetical protein